MDAASSIRRIVGTVGEVVGKTAKGVVKNGWLIVDKKLGELTQFTSKNFCLRVFSFWSQV